MAIKGSFYATSGTDRPYYYSDYNANFKDVFTNGIATRGAELTTQMEVSAVSATMKSQVDLGIAYVEGIRSEIYTAAEEVTHGAADATHPRIDIVALEVNTTAGVRNSRIVIVAGTPGAVPAAPALTEDPTQYQMSLAEVLIPATETDADNFTYTDTRVETHAPILLDATNVNVADVAGNFVGTDAETILAEIMTFIAAKAAASHNHSAAEVTSGLLAVARGGTNAANASDARTSLGAEAILNADQKRKITISSSSPSGGSDGDIWLKY